MHGDEHGRVLPGQRHPGRARSTVRASRSSTRIPLPNQVAGGRHGLQLPGDDADRQDLNYLPTIRGDYQITPGLRVSAKWTVRARVSCRAPGNFPGFTDQIQQFPWSFNTSGTVDYSLTPTMFIEATYGMNQNRLGTPSISPYSNRNNVTCAAEVNGGSFPRHRSPRAGARSCNVAELLGGGAAVSAPERPGHHVQSGVLRDRRQPRRLACRSSSEQRRHRSRACCRRRSPTRAVQGRTR